jgi:hybrid polyketide synthase / nonribosomal peptide synthetase ACE1
MPREIMYISEKIVPKNEPIAIVGSGCRFPGGASTPAKLWNLLSKPHDVLAPIPESRFCSEGFYHEDGEYGGHSNVRDSYLLSTDCTAWDAGFFNIAAGEAVAIDPQQRLLMECVFEALEAGGHSVQGLRGSDTAVYVGLVCEEYSDIHYRELNTIPRVRVITLFLCAFDL